MISLPILGLTDASLDNSLRVQWADGTSCGILGNIEEMLARRQAAEAEEAHKQNLRDQNIAVLDDWRQQ